MLLYHTQPVRRVGSHSSLRCCLIKDPVSDRDPAGRVPRAQYVQWQALAEAAATAQQRGGSSEGASAGMALNMELRQLQQQHQLAMRGDGTAAVGYAAQFDRASSAAASSWDSKDLSNTLLHTLLSEAVAKTMGALGCAG